MQLLFVRGEGGCLCLFVWWRARRRDTSACPTDRLSQLSHCRWTDKSIENGGKLNSSLFSINPKLNASKPLRRAVPLRWMTDYHRRIKFNEENVEYLLPYCSTGSAASTFGSGIVHGIIVKASNHGCREAMSKRRVHPWTYPPNIWYQRKINYDNMSK